MKMILNFMRLYFIYEAPTLSECLTAEACALQRPAAPESHAHPCTCTHTHVHTCTHMHILHMCAHTVPHSLTLRSTVPTWCISRQIVTMADVTGKQPSLLWRQRRLRAREVSSGWFQSAPFLLRLPNEGEVFQTENCSRSHPG